MKKVWLTYAWKDNEDKDIDFIIQELDETDLEIRFDRRSLIPGQRLWTQIGDYITNSEECDAWGIILTSNSINSQPCIEELSYALDRALSVKNEDFPIFALLHHISFSEMPPALRIRLCISLEQDNWVDQVIAAVNKTSVGFNPSDLDEFYTKEHIAGDEFCIEVRPRFNRISPFYIAVDLAENESGNVTNFRHGPAGIVPTGWVAQGKVNESNRLENGTPIWLMGANNEANSSSSYYLFYKKRPKRIFCGHPSDIQELTLPAS